jgi:hypothetical protein
LTEAARAVMLNRDNVSIALCGLADLGIIERAGVVNTGACGRPYVRGRLNALASNGAS